MKKIASLCFISAAVLLSTLVTHFAIGGTHAARGATGIYFTDGGGGISGPGVPGSIRRVNIDGSGLTDIIATGPVVGSDAANSDPRGITLDPVSRVLYWTDMQGGVFRVGVDGSNPGQVTGVVDDEFATQGIDFNSANGRLYYHTGESPEIRTVNTDGSDETTVLDDNQGGFSNDLAVDPVNGHVYWAASNDIYRSDLDGTNIVTIIDDADEPPRGLGLDVAGGKIYYTRGGTGDKTVRRVNLDGTGDEELHFLGSSFAFFGWGIAVDAAAGHVYWADSSQDKIQRSDLDGSNLIDVVTGLDSPYGIVLDTRQMNPVPTLSYWAMVSVALLLLLVGWRALRIKA